MSTETIILTRENDGEWTAIDEQTGAKGHGSTREQALEHLDEAVVRHGDVRIVTTPDVLHRQPRIEGTRLGVFMLGESVRRGDQSVEDILDGYPDLTREQVEAALAYYDTHPDAMDALRDEEDAILQRVANQRPASARDEDADA